MGPHGISIVRYEKEYRLKQPRGISYGIQYRPEPRDEFGLILPFELHSYIFGCLAVVYAIEHHDSRFQFFRCKFIIVIPLKLFYYGLIPVSGSLKHVSAVQKKPLQFGPYYGKVLFRGLVLYPLLHGVIKRKQ